MSNSSLISYTQLSPNHSGQRKHKVDRISPHCVVGQCSIESLGDWFSKSSTGASSNYGIDKDGRIGLFVDENNRSWCTSSPSNDHRAITIECASDTDDPMYTMTDTVFNSLVKLCIDICKRYDKDTLLWIDDKNSALSYIPKDNEMVITVHRWFANKGCPGNWLYSRLDKLATLVTNALQNEKEDEDMTQERFNEMMDNWLKEQSAKDTNASWSAAAREWAEKNGYVQGDENGHKMYKKFLTREEFVTVLHRILGK